MTWQSVTLLGVPSGRWSVWAIAARTRALEPKPVATEATRADANHTADLLAAHDPRARSFLVRSPTGLECHVAHPPGAELDPAVPHCRACGEPLAVVDEECPRCEAVAAIAAKAQASGLVGFQPPSSPRPRLQVLDGGGRDVAEARRRRGLIWTPDRGDGVGEIAGVERDPVREIRHALDASLLYSTPAFLTREAAEEMGIDTSDLPTFVPDIDEDGA